jgi:hypothetical protein
MTDLSTNDISGCQAVCLSLSNCTGATFNSNSGSCVAYSGDYTLVNSKYTANYVMFPIKTQLLIQLKSYNSQFRLFMNGICSIGSQNLLQFSANLLRWKHSAGKLD